jgi:hypothetical protein
MEHPKCWSAVFHYGMCGQSCPCCRAIVEESNLGVCPICRKNRDKNLNKNNHSMTTRSKNKNKWSI